MFESVGDDHTAGFEIFIFSWKYLLIDECPNSSIYSL